MKIETFAPAKVNLSLHVTGQDERGYHLLDSLVVMVDIGDRIWVEPADDLSLDVTGPFALGIPTDGANLVMRAARLLHPGKGARITLEKNLPPASGIGGGSSDAAATIRALSRLWNEPMPSVAALVRLGADVPVCMSPYLTRMQGIGEVLEPISPPPAWPVVLVNPLVEVPTPAVFGALANKNNAAMPDMPEGNGLLDWLRAQRNDLQAPAVSLKPVINDVLTALEQGEGCVMARMSGSGASCFAIMHDTTSCEALAGKIRLAHPNWWVASGQTCFETFI